MTLALLGLLFVTPALAQPTPDPARVALGRELYDLSHISTLADGAAAADAIPGIAITPQVRQNMLELARRMRPVEQDIYAKAYAAHFTLQELKDLVAFYKSPLGAHFAGQQPVIEREVRKPILAQTMALTMALADAKKK